MNLDREINRNIILLDNKCPKCRGNVILNNKKDFEGAIYEDYITYSYSDLYFKCEFCNKEFLISGYSWNISEGEFVEL